MDARLAAVPSGRAFVRPSGTEDVVRLYAEAATEAQVDALALAVAQAPARVEGAGLRHCDIKTTLFISRRPTNTKCISKTQAHPQPPSNPRRSAALTATILHPPTQLPPAHAFALCEGGPSDPLPPTSPEARMIKWHTTKARKINKTGRSTSKARADWGLASTTWQRQSMGVQRLRSGARDPLQGAR